MPSWDFYHRRQCRRRNSDWLFPADLSMTEAATYTILSIGDGLVTQIPAIIVSIAAGILVTRSSEESDLGEFVGRQLTVYPRLWRFAALCSLFAFFLSETFWPFFFPWVLCRRLSFSQESGCGNILRATWRYRFGPPSWRQSIQSRSRFRRCPR